jgi:hypothetical protein
MSYETGHVKHNPETGEVALRTIFPTDQGPQLANMAWLVATKNIGARNASDADVADWDDLYEPPVEPLVEQVDPPAVEPPVVEPPVDEPPVEDPDSDPV